LFLPSSKVAYNKGEKQCIGAGGQPMSLGENKTTESSQRFREKRAMRLKGVPIRYGLSWLSIPITSKVAHGHLPVGPGQQ
jgi:hypothetical protein